MQQVINKSDLDVSIEVNDGKFSIIITGVCNSGDGVPNVISENKTEKNVLDSVESYEIKDVVSKTTKTVPSGHTLDDETIKTLLRIKKEFDLGIKELASEIGIYQKHIWSVFAGKPISKSIKFRVEEYVDIMKILFTV